MSVQSTSKKNLLCTKLSRKETKKPMMLLEDFFSFANLPQAKDLLWEWLKATVTGNYPKVLSVTERANIIYFYEQVEKLIEAAHLLEQKKNK